MHIHLICRKDRYPIVVIDLLMDAQLVDVNVHPSKLGNSSVQGKAAGKAPSMRPFAKHCRNSLRFHALILQRKP